MKLEYTSWKFPLGLGRVEFWIQLAWGEPCLEWGIFWGQSPQIWCLEKKKKSSKEKDGRPQGIWQFFLCLKYLTWQDSFELNWHWEHVEIWPSLALKKDPFGCVLKLWYSIWLEMRGNFSWSALHQPCTLRKLRARLVLSPSNHPSLIPVQSGAPHSYYYAVRGSCSRLLYLAGYESEL